MESMINDLIDFTRGQLGGGIPVARSAESFDELCRRVIDEWRLIHPTRIIQLELSGDLSGRWDGPRVQQAIGNLVGNALRHGQGTVAVSARGEHAGIVLSVHNGGAPIAAEDLPTIFEPFRKGERRSEGLGLGLYIVREIVQGHGGTIHVWSSEAEGTTFLTYWPRDGSRTPPPVEMPGTYSV
jgi:signal transduction histidine kinase